VYYYCFLVFFLAGRWDKGNFSIENTFKRHHWRECLLLRCTWLCFSKNLNFFIKLIFFVFLDYFDMLISEINFKKLKIYYFNIFLKNYF